MGYELVCGDAVAWANAYAEKIARGEARPFHVMGNDAPYHMVSVQKRFGKAGSAEAKPGRDGSFARLSKGFMNAGWDGAREDGTFVAYDPRTWAAFGSVMYPGALGYTYTSAQSVHRTAVAMEDAGWVLLPTLFAWSYASGFPKCRRIDLAADVEEGVESLVVGQQRHAPKFDAAAFGNDAQDNGWNRQDREVFDVKVAASELGQAWADYYYGGQPLKPAVEPVILAYWPRADRPIEGILETGAGGVNIGGSRQNGKWPANLATIHHPFCAEVCHPECAVRRLEVQYGSDLDGELDCVPQFGWDYEHAEWLVGMDPVRYVPKPGRTEKDAGLEAFPDITVNDGRDKAIDNPFQRGKTSRKLPHPTVKPLAMSRWLSTLLLPPERYGPRRLFNPFMGSGSEVIGALAAGFEEVVGVELTESYLPYADARIRYWVGVGFTPPQRSRPVKSATAAVAEQPALALWE